MIYIFVGTTAELIKLLPVIADLKKRGIPFKIAASGQNDLRESELWPIANVTKIDILISDKPIKQSALGLLAWFIKTICLGLFRFRKELKSSKNNIVIVHGDTVSTLMGALLGKACGAKIFHVEAGLRSFNYLKPFPEEICRVIVSRLTSASFCPNDWSANNLKNSKSEVIVTHQNTLLDSMTLALGSAKDEGVTSNSSKPYFLFVLHRQENLFNQKFVRRIIEVIAIKAISMKCVFILHEPTRVTLDGLDLLKGLQNDANFTLLPRQAYLKFTQLLEGCQFIVTDGGSNQEESYYFGKPCLVLRSETERIEGLDQNVCLSNRDFQKIKSFLDDPMEFKSNFVKPKESPTKIIVDYIQQHIKLI